MEGKEIRVNNIQKKLLILSYYWPPSGGSGVQRWMYFAKYLKKLGYEPIVDIKEGVANFMEWYKDYMGVN